ncbi:protein containg FOG: FHA domain [Longilinea arvoryzae]|uniref:Protein containg FOG: FHA domain n=1 Tax=Longilinea arvoryzae TaxID=360412 RepID=A0A0S7BMA5_9CHLR|nr:FHA domain-containing protein [Longilinea arvoryzae]GAP15131.1 protein containg FOG: FHA domain [Longilinea arvoryzae]
MSAFIVLFLRLVLAISLYVFLIWALYTLWRDFRAQTQLVTSREIPALVLALDQDEITIDEKFTQPEVIIGRDPATTFPINDETVSAHHARMSYYKKQWWLEDLHSTNGSFLNDERVISPVVVTSGDIVRCGQAEVLVTILYKS